MGGHTTGTKRYTEIIKRDQGYATDTLSDDEMHGEVGPSLKGRGFSGWARSMASRVVAEHAHAIAGSMKAS